MKGQKIELITWRGMKIWDKAKSSMTSEGSTYLCASSSILRRPSSN